jgi:hypothetical protein
MREILSGQSPAVAFASYLEMHPNLSNGQLWIEFVNTFPKTDGVSANIIAHWRRREMADDLFDAEIRALLKDAKHLA